MSKIVCLFRAMNVGGKNRVKMAELADFFRSAGFTGVSTYIQSGNVVFDHPAESMDEVKKRISRGFAPQFGFGPSLLLADTTEMAHILANNPYKGQNLAPDKVFVTLLESVPQPGMVDGLRALLREGEQMHAFERALFLNLPEGYGETKITGKAIERKLGQLSTARNWRTMEVLMQMMAETV